MEIGTSFFFKALHPFLDTNECALTFVSHIMKHFFHLSLLLCSLHGFGQKDLSASDEKFIEGYTFKLGYTNSTNHWTGGGPKMPDNGYSTHYSTVHVDEQRGHGLVGEFEIKFKRISLSFGLNLSFWNDSIHGYTARQNYHPNAPQGYPLINDYSTSNAYYSAKGSELIGQIGVRYWLQSPEKHQNIGIGVATNPRLNARQNIQSQRTDNYFIYEVGPWMGQPASLTETFSTLETTSVVENGLTTYSGGNNVFDELLKNSNISISAIARVKITKNVDLESTIGYRFQRKSRIAYNNLLQNAGFFSQVMLCLNF